jgi:hypothetical protein
MAKERSGTGSKAKLKHWDPVLQMCRLLENKEYLPDEPDPNFRD